MLIAHVWFHENGIALVGIVHTEGPGRGLFLSTAAIVTPPIRPKANSWYPNKLDALAPMALHHAAVPDLCQPQLKFLLLKSCLALPKEVFLLRITGTTTMSLSLTSLTQGAQCLNLSGSRQSFVWSLARLACEVH